MEDLGSKLRELRVKKGYTQEYVARKFNVTRQTISKWENNKTTPDIETLKKICEFYSTNINSILNEDNLKNKQNNLLVLTAIIFNIFVTRNIYLVCSIWINSNRYLKLFLYLLFLFKK